MNKITTTVTKDRTLRVFPNEFGLTRKTGYSVSRTRTGNWSLKSTGGRKRLQSDGRIEFSVADTYELDRGDKVDLSWRKRGDSVILSIADVAINAG